jgi:hypothetical protein
VLRVAAELAGALDFAAVINITHGALHPRDVLLSPEESRGGSSAWGDRAVSHPAVSGLGAGRPCRRCSGPD